MMIFFLFHIQSSSFQGFADRPLLSKGRISFPETFANLVVAILFLFRCRVGIFIPSPHAFLTQSRTLPVTHAAKHTITHPSTLLHMRHAQPDSWPRPPRRGGGAGGKRMVPHRGVSLEMNLAPQSPDIHTQWVHSHTCLIAWPIGGGAQGGALSSRRTVELLSFVVHLSS